MMPVTVTAALAHAHQSDLRRRAVDAERVRVARAAARRTGGTGRPGPRLRLPRPRRLLWAHRTPAAVPGAR
jgi:hypothetical protein